MEGFTIEVKNPAGEVVAVDAINLEIGDSEVTFDFTTALTEVALGNWTVGGVTFDTAKVAAVADINAATNVVELWEALQSTYFTGAVQANITEYDTLLDGTQETVEEIQTIIDEVNAASVSEEEAAAVVDSTNVLQLLNALKDPAFVRVNDAWITDYSTQTVVLDDASSTPTMIALVAANYFGETAGTTIEEIQVAIDAQNVIKVNAAITAAEGDVDTSKVTTARNLVNKYIPADEENDTTKADLLDRLAVQDAVIAVVSANTNAKLTNALNALDVLDTKVNDPKDLDLDTVNSALLKEYRAKFEATTTVTDKNDIAKIQGLIDDVNDAAQTTLLTAVKTKAAAGTLGTAADEAKVESYLKTYGMKNVLPAGYLTTAARTALAPVALEATASGDYLELTSAAQLEVAELFLAIKETDRTNLTDKKYTVIADIKTDLESVTTDYTTLLDDVNTAVTKATMRTALSNLGIEAFDNLDPSAQLDAAEAFLNAFPVDADDNRVLYTTLSSIEAAL